MINLKNMRLGAVNKSVTGDLVEVVEYENSQNIKVKFLDKYGAEVNTAWQYFESGWHIWTADRSRHDSGIRQR